jgi:hypothetical protein
LNQNRPCRDLIGERRRVAFGPARPSRNKSIKAAIGLPQAADRPRIVEGLKTMHDEMSDLAPALLMAVIVAVGLVAFQFHSVANAKPAQAVQAKVDKSKSDKSAPQLAVDDRLYWIR